MEVILEANTPIEVTNETKAIRGPRGYSSYEIAVQNGFVGSELEWLASLVGAKGEDGKAGSPGVGIIAITKIKTEGLVDTYQIDYSNGGPAFNPENEESMYITYYKNSYTKKYGRTR